MMINVNGYTSKKSAIRAVNDALFVHGKTLKSVLGNPSANMKVFKNRTTTFPLNLMPSDSSGVMNTCTSATL